MTTFIAFIVLNVAVWCWITWMARDAGNGVAGRRVEAWEREPWEPIEW